MQGAKTNKQAFVGRWAGRQAFVALARGGGVRGIFDKLGLGC